MILKPQYYDLPNKRRHPAATDRGIQDFFVDPAVKPRDDGDIFHNISALNSYYRGALQ